METMNVAEDPHRTWLADSRNLHRLKSVRAEAKGLPPLGSCGLLDTQTQHAYNTALHSEGVRKILLASVCPVTKN